MNFVADENVDSQIVTALRDAGHGVLYVAEAECGISDDSVLAKATAAGAVLLTSDKDFGDLVFRQGKAMGGVLLLRLAGVSNTEKVRLVMRACQECEHELTGAFSVLTQTALRIRRREQHLK